MCRSKKKEREQTKGTETREEKERTKEGKHVQNKRGSFIYEDKK